MPQKHIVERKARPVDMGSLWNRHNADSGTWRYLEVAVQAKRTEGKSVTK